MKTDEALNPCPICGSENVSVDAVILAPKPFRIICECGIATKTFRNEFSLIEYWNTRPSPWIPVGERLPAAVEHGFSNYVFVQNACGGIGQGIYFHRDKTWCNTPVVDITHWMPIPELEGGKS